MAAATTTSSGTRADLAGRTVVITGASSGFGKGVARRLAEQGARLVLVARRTDLIEALAKECGDAIAVTADVGNANEVERVANAALVQYGGFDAWINDAGVAALGYFDEIPLEDHHRVVQTNLLGVINGSHCALHQFRRQGHGTLVNIASVLGKVPAPYYASYVATKFGVVGLGAALRQELRASGENEAIHVCTVLPGAADTTFFVHAANYTGHRLQPYPLDDPEPVIEAIVSAVENPRDEIAVGTGTSAAILSHNLAPGLTDIANGVMTHANQMEQAPEQLPTPGSLHQPQEAGRGVHGGLKQQLAREQGGMH